MNDKLKAVLMTLASELKQLRWNMESNFEIALTSEEKIEMVKAVNVSDGQAANVVDVLLQVSLESDDQITFYPTITISGEMFLNGADIKDINQQTDIDVGFTEADAKNIAKVKDAAGKINRYAVDYVENEFNEYASASRSDVAYDSKDGWKADTDLTSEL